MKTLSLTNTKFFFLSGTGFILSFLLKILS